ncbi:cytochrome c peroxidase [Shimia gijangensis]|uniref:Cytochrome c peroxidase n=1 Tax=Shimia gijangensis TaxID=1470563 RepID=A0A1M6TV67_9RHOB|nr:His-Xaa-Ser system-associated MauG-like protein [Shimia gijangensis]SHK60794.1 cytochrome c peroxidase [Shimia gijangensis]
MKFATSFLTAFTAFFSIFPTFAQASDMRSTVLKNAALDAGFLAAHETHVATNFELVLVGKTLFESRLLSLAEDIACASCHLDQFGSADGLPIAIGTEGTGVGAQRVVNGGDIVPRNTLPFWGRGGVGFNVFFWDGKVDSSSGKVKSQFGDHTPSHDPLVVAVHLPPVEVGEMVIDLDETKILQTESLSSADSLYTLIAERIEKDEEISLALAKAKEIEKDQIVFRDIAEAIAAFIRFNFRVKPTRFHEFVFGNTHLTDLEQKGGLLFYGRGGCSQCHNGPYFSDLEFHPVAFPQVGFGKNGFGVDYGRFNVTLSENDKYTFRTPPLLNVTKTAPYSHSGSTFQLSEAIRAHIDPLALIDTKTMSANARVEFYEKLKLWGSSATSGAVLTDEDIQAIEAFLHTLEYESEMQVNVVD